MSRAPDRHFILTLGRSGSNYFVNVVNQHPQLLNYGEVLGSWTTVQKLVPGAVKRRFGEAVVPDVLLGSAAVLYAAQLQRAARRLAKGESHGVKRRSRLRSVGVKDFSLNLGRMGLASYLDDRPDIKVIALFRRDVLDRAISYRMLERSGVVLARAGEATPRPAALRLEPEGVVELLGRIEAENRELEAMVDRLAPERVLRIEYETYFHDPDVRARTDRALFAFLGADPFEPEVRMRKIIRRPPSEVIENWAECREAVRGTRFEPLFEAAS